MRSMPIRLALVVLLAAVSATASARPIPAPTRSSISQPARRMLQLWRQARSQPGARLGTQLGTRAMVKGRTYSEFPALLQRQARPMTKKQRVENTDATFRGTHPMFKRLVSSGWYRQPGKIAELQRMANNLRQTRTLSGGKQLSKVEYLAFDLEATNGAAGRFHKGRQRVLAGWDEVAQFGYTIYRGGKKVRSGTIDIKPDVQISSWVQENCKLTPKSLASAPRFETAAKQILGLMQGRVLIGQSATKKDWSWLQSNFARLGVNLPGPKKLVLDTHYLSFNHFPQGSGLKGLSQHFRVNQSNHHNARYDAEATGDVFFAMMRKNGTSTLGQAFAQQQRGYERMKNPQARGAVRPTH